MKSCIAIVSDLIFSSRIKGTAGKVGAKCKTVRSTCALSDALESETPETVLVDLQCDGISPEEAIRTVKEHSPTTRVVAYCSHVQTDLMEQAKAAGADEVWPRSVFVQRLPELLAGNDATDEAAPPA